MLERLRLIPAPVRWVSLVLLGFLGQPAFGQVQGYPLDPTAPLERTLPAPVQGYPIESAGPDPRPTIIAPVEVPPRPTACPLEPNTCNDGFQLRTRGGGVVEGFPPTLLWEPPMANLREPRLLFLPNTLSNDTTLRTLDTTIGTTLGLVRVGPEDATRRVQLDLFALVATRISQYDYLVCTDYRAGLPLTFAWGPWHGKIAYEHTSTHLGDETITRTGRQPTDSIKDEVTFGIGRWLFRDSLRLYGQAGWAFFIDVPGDPSPFRFDLGFEWYRRRVTGVKGQPFAAGNVEFNGVYDYKANLSLQAGWQWRDPNRRMSELRVFAQYYTGQSIYGQFIQDPESWFGVGIAMDY